MFQPSLVDAQARDMTDASEWSAHWGTSTPEATSRPAGRRHRGCASAERLVFSCVAPKERSDVSCNGRVSQQPQLP
jgi:hypothetical protein